MKDFGDITSLFVVFFGQDSDEYGENYPEIVDAAAKIYRESGKESLDRLIRNIDDFRESYPENDKAAAVLNKLTRGSAGDTRYYEPTLLEFLAWLSARLKQKREESKA